MRRRVYLILIFLIALASNCVQASRIDFDPIPSSLSILTGAANDQADEFQFVIITNDDDSDDTPTPIHAQTTIENIQSIFLSMRLNVSTAVTATLVERSTVLRL
jgi:hypothetical protein